MNILEEEDFIKGLPDSALMEEAQRPTGTLTQYVVVSEIKRRSDMRKEHEAQLAQGPQSTVKDQIVGEAMQGGIMGAMPPQMAMAPQMAQRMPNMPPQGIQQAMPPQMMSGGGIVGMTNGGFLDEVVVKAPNLSEQKLEELIIDGVPTVDLIQMGFTSDDISRVGSQIDPRIIREGKKILGAAPDAIYDTLTFDSDRGESIVGRGQEARDRQVSDAKASFMGRTDIPPVDPPQEAPFRYNLRLSGFPEAGRGSPILDPLLAGLGSAYDRFMERSDRVAANRSGIASVGTEGGDSSGRDRMAALEDQAAQGAIGTPIVTQSGTGSAGPVQLDNTEEQILANLSYAQDLRGGGQDQDNAGGLVPNTSEISKYLNLGPDGAVRAGGDDAMLPSGPERASGALNELKDMINRQSKFSSSTNRGAAMVALGTGIMEGKTAEGGRAAAKILSDDAKTQGALQLEGAKIAAADERERNRLAVMREDLQNKLGISQNASNRTALAEVNRALAEYDGFTIRGLADKIAKGMPLTPEESMYMTLQKAQQMLIPIVAPATRSLFAGAGNRQQPTPTGGGAVDPSQFDPANRRT
jgi:hypothetical protein